MPYGEDRRNVRARERQRVTVSWQCLQTLRKYRCRQSNYWNTRKTEQFWKSMVVDVTADRTPRWWWWWWWWYQQQQPQDVDGLSLSIARGASRVWSGLCVCVRVCALCRHVDVYKLVLGSRSFPFDQSETATRCTASATAADSDYVNGRLGCWWCGGGDCTQTEREREREREREVFKYKTPVDETD